MARAIQPVLVGAVGDDLEFLDGAGAHRGAFLRVVLFRERGEQIQRSARPLELGLHLGNGERLVVPVLDDLGVDLVVGFGEALVGIGELLAGIGHAGVAGGNGLGRLGLFHESPWP